MSQEYRDTLQRNTRQEQFDSEDIPETVRMAIPHSSELEKFLQAALPVADGALRL